MKSVENECVSCGLPCFSSCPYLHVTRYYCDKCGEEIGPEIYRVDDEDLCEYCLKDMFKIDLEAEGYEDIQENWFEIDTRRA